MITIEEVRALYSGADAVHDFDHVLRVLALAERLAESVDHFIHRSRSFTIQSSPCVSDDDFDDLEASYEEYSAALKRLEEGA